MAVQTQIQVRRGTAATWTSTNPTLAAGEIGFESDTGKIKVGTGSATWNSLTYIGAANAIQYVYNASAGQTTFSGADANGATLAYTVGAEQVYVNGVLQVRNTDYTATNGTSVVLTTATIASDIVTVVALGTFTVADTYTQAQANATFPLNSIDKSAGKNKIINGDFGVWQRGTSFSGITSRTYTADRWCVEADISTSASQQAFTPGTAPVAGYESSYFLRYVKSAGGSFANLQQLIEDVRTFAGQTVTVSFWAKADATITVYPYIFQNFGSGGSASVGTSVGSGVTLTTSWQRFSATVTLASIAGKTIGANNNLQVYFTRLTTAAAATIDTWGCQIEAGSVATSFQTATGTIQGELAACQRYLPAFSGSSLGGNLANVLGWAYSTTNAQFNIMLPVTPRVRPTGLTYSALSDFTIANQSFSGAAPTAIAFNSGGQMCQINVTTTAGSPTLVLGQPVNLALSGANGLLLFTGCEL